MKENKMSVTKSIEAVNIMSMHRNAVSRLFALITIGAIIGVANALPPNRIMGGSLATKGEFSAMVSLTHIGSFVHRCGGGVIGPRHILTAAHCVDTKSTNDINVRAGIHDIKDVDNVVERSVRKVYIHPDYVSYIPEKRAVQNDLAVLVLKESLPMGDRINAFMLPTHQPEYGFNYITAGWGINDPKPDTYQFQLKTLIMTLNEASKCSSSAPQTICAIAESGTACSGDSGGPLTRGGYIYGITSTSSCTIGDPVNFVNVYNFVEWIKEIIRSDP